MRAGRAVRFPVGRDAIEREDAPVKTLGRYQLLEELGRGGVGVVYPARDPQLGRDVAIKVLLHEASPEELVRFEREAVAAAKLRHRNIVTIHNPDAHRALTERAVKHIYRLPVHLRQAFEPPLPR
jgi:eukaryotic-like serine/threonine-protein kinase